MRFTKMRFITVFLFLLIILPMANAQKNETVNIHVGIGAGTGDNPPPFEEEEEEEETEYDHFIRKITQKIGLKTQIPKKNFNANVRGRINLENTLNTYDTTEKPKEPINWTPIVIWSIVIIFLVVLVGGAWYIYQIYFY